MRPSALLALAAVATAAAACDQPSPPLPPLLADARTTGGANFLCDPDVVGAGEPGTTPDTVSHSPEIVARLSRDFPPGSPAERLAGALRAQGFTLHSCPGDPAVRYARFDQEGGNGITAMAATGIVYWKADLSGRIVWTTGDIGYRGL